MHRRFMLAIAIAAVATLAVVGAAVAAPSATATRDAAGMTRVAQLEGDVLTALNEIRREHGLVPLKLSTTLSKAALEHSRQMAELGYFQHDSADGAPFWKRVERYYPSKGARYWSVGENLLWSSPNVDAPGAMKLWMASPEHRKNILTARWREIGVSAVQVAAAPGSFNGLDVTILTTDFGIRR
jgi:uncharacterized protein YkwD